MFRTSSAMPSHTQCRSSRAIVASTRRCPAPSRWAYTSSRFFRESAPAGTQITGWSLCSTRYSPSESSEATPIAASRVGPPSATAASTPRTTFFSRKRLAPSEKHLRVLDAHVHADCPSRPRHPLRQQASPQFLSPAMCTIGEARGFTHTVLAPGRSRTVIRSTCAGGSPNNARQNTSRRAQNPRKTISRAASWHIPAVRHSQLRQ